RAVSAANCRRHVDDPSNELGTLQVRHFLPAAEELFTGQLVARDQRGNISVEKSRRIRRSLSEPCSSARHESLASLSCLTRLCRKPPPIGQFCSRFSVMTRFSLPALAANSFGRSFSG